jgi:anti-sigma factor RsiW
MCDAEKNLVAWLDGELPVEEAASVERHVSVCEECRGRIAAFRRVSESVDLYCDAVMAVNARQHVPRWAKPVLAFAAAAAIVLFVMVSGRNSVPPPPVLTPTIADASTIVRNSAATISATETSPDTAKLRGTIHQRPHVGSSINAEAAKWQPNESAVQIAIPADAMFPPGAMPKGLNFVAELSIGPDGSVRQVRLRQ